MRFFIWIYFLVTNMQIGRLFPARRALIITIINGLYGTSAAVPTIIKLILRVGVIGDCQRFGFGQCSSKITRLESSEDSHKLQCWYKTYINGLYMYVAVMFRPNISFYAKNDCSIFQQRRRHPRKLQYWNHWLERRKKEQRWKGIDSSGCSP